MKREIKFRAWDKTDKVMIYDTDTILLKLDGEILIGDDYCGSCDQYKYGTEEKSTVEILQYTGLKDKNDNDIYEGDILEYYWDGKVKIDYIEFRGGSFTYSKCMRWSLNQDKVIGNIYENPELLEDNQ